MAPRRTKTTRTLTKDELLANLATTNTAFEAALAEYHRMPCTSTENARRTAYALQEKAYAAAEAAGVFAVDETTRECLNLPHDLESLARLVLTTSKTTVVTTNQEAIDNAHLYKIAAIRFAEAYLSRTTDS